MFVLCMCGWAIAGDDEAAGGSNRGQRIGRGRDGTPTADAADTAATSQRDSDARNTLPPRGQWAHNRGGPRPMGYWFESKLLVFGSTCAKGDHKVYLTVKLPHFPDFFSYLFCMTFPRIVRFSTVKNGAVSASIERLNTTVGRLVEKAKANRFVV